MNGVAVFEHEGEADRPEQDAADAGVGDAFDEDVHRLALAGEAGFEHDEADLHAEDEERGDQRPGGVDRVDRRHRVGGCISAGGVRRLRQEPRNEHQHRGQADRLPSINSPTLRRTTGLRRFVRNLPYALVSTVSIASSPYNAEARPRRWICRHR